MTILSINNVSKSFGKHKVLDNVSFHIKEPEIVALVGRGIIVLSSEI